jgi:dipeptidyl aminopeptidase/acylaminoacyl peptidase
VRLLHGAADPVVSVSESEAVLVGLRRPGKPVTLVRYAGEDHHPMSWSAAKASDYWARIFSFLQEHLL